MCRKQLVVFAGLVLLSQAAQLPKGFNKCHLKAPDAVECITKSVESAIQQLKNGAPELAIKPFEPLDISALTIGEGTGPVNVQQNFKNVKLHGLTGSKVLEARVLLDDNMLTAISVTPELRLEAEYNMRGRILLLPIVGDGNCNVTLLNMRINHTLHGERFKKKGNSYLRFVRYDVTMRPDKVRFQFANLFDGNEQLGTELNKVLNDNWDAVFGDVRGGYEKSFGLIFQDLANRLFSRVALKDIFLDFQE